MSWNEYVSSLQEVEAFQKKVRRSRAKKIKTYYRGKQKAGAPYTENPTKGRGSAPPPFGAMGEEVEKEDFEAHPQLEPTVWRDKKLDPQIRDRLLEIAQNFIGALSKDVEIRDIHITGSLANYNWSSYSDLDLRSETALQSIDRLKSKIRRMRRAGLGTDAREFSPENIAFKILRRDGVLKKLNDLKYTAYDSHMSSSEKEDGIS
jgi:hypothetical protein